MRGMLAPLSRFEETALRKVAAEDSERPAPEHARRLLQLDLILWDGLEWCLTKAGRRRYDAMVSSERQRRPGLPDRRS
jgi:hypothetical protein